MITTRRDYLKAIGKGLAAAVVAEGAKPFALAALTESKADASKLAMPGLYRGRVCAVQNPAVLVSGHYQAEAVRQMMRRGMMELTGADGWVDAWRRFFEPGDVVGIKVSPVGQPLVDSDATVVREIIAGLEAAGVKRQDIVVYDRYRGAVHGAGYDKWLPEGVRTSSAAEEVDRHPAGDRGLRPGPLHGHGADLAGLHRRQRHGAPLLCGPLHHPRGQQAYQPPLPEGPPVGRHHAGAQEPLARPGQQREPQPRHQ